MTSEQQPWGAVVLAGGRGRRLGGVDKATLQLDGESFVDRALDAVAGASDVVVVGPPSAVRRAALFTTEDPPGAGPAAALLHGTDVLPARCAVVVVLAVDMPLVGRSTVRRLLAALRAGVGGDGAVLHDGRAQPLCAAYRRSALATADPGAGARRGLPVHRLVQDLRLAEVPARGQESRDVDEPGDLDVVRESIRPLPDPRSAVDDLDS